MRKTLLVSSLVLVVLLAATGCKDITASFKPGSFGASAQETAMITALTTKHGDLRESGPPRFLETMMTSKVENGMPADRVTKYSKDTKKLYAWFVYDNFNEDVLEIEWIYVPQSHSIHTFKSQTGKDFGRGTFILEQPDSGWPTGAYRVLIRGRGIVSTIDFEIISGATVSVPVLLPGGQVQLPPRPAGWHLKGWDYIISQSDVTLHQNGYYKDSALMGTSSRLYDYIKGTGEKGNFTVALWRADAAGKQLAGSTSTSTWDEPPLYLEPGKKIALQVTRAYDGTNTWGQNGLRIKFDSNDLPGAGYATSSSISFVNAGGTSYLHTYSGPVETEKAIPTGKPGDLKAIWVYLEGYSFRYTYEWRN